jgi:TP901 family phage tail tape measure protein
LQQINIRFNGQANFGAVESELAALRRQFAALQAQAMKAANAGGKGAGYERVAAQLEDVRRGYLQSIAASNQFEIRQTKTISQAEEYSKRLRDQKVHLGEAIKNRKLFNQVVKDQIALQRAQAVSWSKGPDGRISADLIMPKDAVSAIDAARTRMGMFNTVLQSVADNTVKWGKNTQWAGRQLMVGFTVPMAIAAAATGKLAYEMDKQLTQVTKVYGDANSAIQDTTESIRSASMQTAQNMTNLYGQSMKDTLEMTAQFAAAGKTGLELQNATAAATKARQLNEIDLQTAISASIAMQTVYGYSSEELGQKWDYINAVANQTVLGAEDFAVAIPKVSGVLKEMGASLEDVGVLMTAFKSAGIDAAEGANALKTISFRAVSAYGKGLETFTKMTGKNLQDIVAETNGETIPTLLKMYDAMKNLSTPQRIAVVKDVFGIYQGNKAMILMEQLASQSEQVSQALAVGKNSVAENARIANQELQRMNDQPFKKLQKAVESIKNEMALAGEAVLPWVAGIASFVNRLIKSFNGLDDGFKHAAGLIAVVIGLAGPLTMLLGLFGNLAGNAMKFMGVLGQLTLRFRITDANQRAQQLIGKQSASVWDQQTAAVARLTMELQTLNQTMAKTAAAKIPNTRPPAMATYNQGMYSATKDPNTGQMRYRNLETGRFTSREKYEQYKRENAVLAQQNRLERDRAHEAALVEDRLRSQAAAQKDVSRAVGGTMAGVGMLGTMFLDADSKLGKLSQGLFALGMLNTLFPSIGVSLAKGLILPFRALSTRLNDTNGRLGQMAGRAKGFATQMGKYAQAALGPVALATTAAIIYWQKVDQEQQKSLQKVEAYNRSTQTFSELLGQNYNQTTGVPEMKKTDADNVLDMALKFREANEKAADMIAASGEGKKIGDKWAIAIAQGVKVRLHGGTVDAAKEATRVALQLMGERFTNAEFEATIKTKVEFTNPDDLIKYQMKSINDTVEQAANDLGGGWEKWNRENINGVNDLTKAAAADVKKQGTEFFQLLSGIPDPAKRRQIFDTFRAEQEKDLRALYEKLRKDGVDIAKNNDFTGFLSALPNDVNLAGEAGVSNDQANMYKRQAEALKILTQQIAATGGVAEVARGKMNNLGDVAPALKALFQIDTSQAQEGIDIVTGYPKMYDEYAKALMHATMGGKKLTEAEQLLILNQVRTSNGMSEATSVAQGFNIAQVEAAQATLKLADAMQQLGMKTSEEQVTSTYRAALEGAQGDLVSAAQDSLQQEADISNQNLQDAMDAAMAEFDKRADSLDAKYDKRQKAMEDRHDKETEALDKRWDRRKKAEEAYYDNRIKKVDAAIEAEQKADDIRQKLFEAEKTRIERMAQLANRNIDFNVALNSGNMDEAAKISNDMLAQNEQWMTEDANAAQDEASKKRVDALQKQKDQIGEAKKARMDALAEVEAAEKKALQKRQENETEALRIARDGAKKRLDAEKKANQQRLQDGMDKNRKLWEDRRRNLQLELDSIRAFIPRNEKELRAQAARIDAAYKKYGGNLKAYGNSWAGYIGTSLKRNVSIAGDQLKTSVNWANIGSTIAQGLLKGSFGMTPKQFAAWLNGGDAPKGSIFAPNTTYKRTKKQQYDYDLRHQGRHDGGIIGQGTGSRTGHSGQQSQSEVWINALKGEAVLNRKATDVLGEENITNLNKGKLPANTGPWGPVGIAASIAAGATKRLMGEVLLAVATRKMMMDSPLAGTTGTPGSYGLTGFDAFLAAISGQESGGNYGAVNKDSGALGKYQVMPNNVGPWARKYLGVDMTPSQFLGDPALQERLVRAVLGSYYSQYGPRGAAAAWYSGDPKLDMDTRSQNGYPSIKDYVDSIMKKMGSVQPGADGYQGLGLGINMAQYSGGSVGGGWQRPAGGSVTSEYGMRVNPVTGVYRLHAGTDIGAGMGAPIYAARAGRVVSAGMTSGYGNYTIIDHGNGIRTAYAHQSKLLVSPGQMVNGGQKIGLVGSTGNSTGPHLHFEYMKNGERLNPRQIMPSLNVGGWTMSDGLAKLHKDEAVLTKPLSANLKDGINQLAQNDNSKYNMYMDFRGATFSADVDVERALDKAMQKRERRVGVKRKIG